jgi:hypothetical protein
MSYSCIRTADQVPLPVYIRKLQEELESTGELDAIIKLEGGSVISFTLIPKQQPQPRPWWQIWRKK